MQEDVFPFTIVVGVEQELISSSVSFLAFTPNYMRYVVQYVSRDFKDDEDKSLGKEERHNDEDWVIDRLAVTCFARFKTWKGMWKILIAIEGMPSELIVLFKTKTACQAMMDKLRQWKYPETKNPDQE